MIDYRKLYKLAYRYVRAMDRRDTGYWSAKTSLSIIRHAQPAITAAAQTSFASRAVA
jgi:hypothetical protein